MSHINKSYAHRILRMLEKVLDYEDLQKVHRREALGGGLGYIVGGVAGHAAAHYLNLPPVSGTASRLAGGEIAAILGRALGHKSGQKQLQRAGKL